MKQIFSDIKIYIFLLLSFICGSIAFAQNTPSGSKLEEALPKLTKDEILKTPFGTFNLSQTTGDVYRISGDELRKTIGNNVSQSLVGKVPGLRVIRGNNLPGENGYSFLLNGGAPYVLIDGEPRGLEVDLREVEEVLILSDATFNSLLGILGDNGLIYIITKRGKSSKPVVEANYQRGLNFSTRMPKLLSAGEYASVINRASVADGFGEIYSASAIQAYNDGSNTVKYPNINYQEKFLNKSSSSNYASVNIYGGKDNVSYGAFIGYDDYQGLEKIGTQIDGRDITFRTKIETRMNDLISAHASVYGNFGQKKRPVLGSGTMFNWISNTPANSSPLMLGDTAYVVSYQFPNNLLAELKSGGTATEYDARMIFDIGFDVDFDKYVPGLKYQSYVMMRTFDYQTLQADNTPALYTMENFTDGNGKESIGLKVYTIEFKNLNVSRSSSELARNFVYSGNLSYSKVVGKGNLNMNLSHMLYYQPTPAATEPDVRQLTYNLNGSYALDNKYIMYANLNSSSTSKNLGDNRTKLFPTLGLAWVASNEGILKDNDAINFLKFRTSYGIIGTEYTAATLYYLDTWTSSGTTYTGIGSTAQNKFGYKLSQKANKEIDWILYNQFNAGLELQMLNKINVNFNYFNIGIEGQITKASEMYADALGYDAFLPNLNFTSRRNTGFNYSVSYRNTENEFKYYLGVNSGYNRIIGEKISEYPYPDQYRLQQGMPEDNIMGYVSDGLFTESNIGSALPQFGNVKVGDVKYKDLNDDKIIDSRDQKAIGNSTPRFNYGVNLGAQFKGFNLDVVGAGVAGYDINLSSKSYYQHYGLDNYFGSVNSKLPNGNENPRLSKIRSLNNYRNSDYWLIDGGYFRIVLLEFGYTLPEKIVSSGPLKLVKFFVRGSNLALFSKMKDLDPEDLDAGVYEYPMMSSYVLGASLSF